MPSFFMLKDLEQRLVPDDDEARKYLKRLKPGEPVLVSVKKPRNIQFHRKYFSLLNLAFSNQDVYDDFEAFRKEVAMRAGFWQEHIHVTGAISYTAKSIAFHAMDELEFADLYQKSIDAIIAYFMPDTDPEQLAQAVEEIVGFA